MKQYIETFKKENIVYKMLTLLIIAIIVVFLGRIIKNTIVGLEYPNELLEPANINLTNSILSGNVPYSLDNLVVPGMEEPPVNFEYPFVHSLVAVLFSCVFGGNTIASHYFVSFMAMIGTAVLGSVIIYRNSRTTVGATAGFLFLMFCHWRYGYVSASPDGFGLFIAMLTLYLACSPKLKHRATWVSLGTVVAFYSKQYFAFVCVSIFIYFFCYSRKEALKYLGWCVGILATSMVLVTWKWPLFWTYSVLLLMHGCFQGWDVAGFMYVLEQMKYFAVVFAVLIVVIAVYYFQKVKKQKTVCCDSTTDIGLMKANLISEGDAIPLFLIQIPVQIVILFIFGRNDGAYLTYFLQLLMPSILLSMVLILERMDILKCEMIFACGYSIVILFVAFFGWSKLPMHMINNEDKSNWERAYALIDEYRDKGDICHSQISAYNAIEHGDSVFGTGHDGDIIDSTYNEWKANQLQQILFPYAGKVFEENLEYRKYLYSQIEDHRVSLVVIWNCFNLLASEEQMKDAGYYVKESFPLQLGNMEYEANFWVYE